MWRNKSEIEKLKAEVKSLCHAVYQHIEGIDSNIGALTSIIDHITVRELRAEIFSYLSELSASLYWPFGDLDAMQCRLEEFEKNIEEYENWIKKKSPD